MVEPWPDRPDDRPPGRRGALTALLGCGGVGAVLTVVGFVAITSLLALNLQGCDFDVGEIGDPGQGTESERLAVDVSPTVGLVHRSEVQVSSDAFEPHSIVGVAVCLASADSDGLGLAACDDDQGARYATDGSGRLVATYAVPQVIRVDGTDHDCAAEAERCIVVAADANDYDRSGGQPISFAPDQAGASIEVGMPQVETYLLPITADPPGPVAPEARVRLAAQGFQPGEPLLLAWCTDDFPQQGPVQSCEPLDPNAALTALVTRTVPAEAPVADRNGTFETTVAVPATVAPYGSGGRTDPGAPVDCRARAGRCSVVVAAAADTRRSAVWPYTLAAG